MINDAIKLLLGNQEGTKIEIVRYSPMIYNMVVIYSYIDRSSYYGEERIHYGRRFFRKREICNEILKLINNNHYIRFNGYIVNQTFSEISKNLDEEIFINKNFHGNIFINFEIIFGTSCISLYIPWSKYEEHNRYSFFHTDGENLKKIDKDKLKFSPHFLDAMSEMENQVPAGIQKFLEEADLEELFEQELLIREVGEN